MGMDGVRGEILRADDPLLRCNGLNGKKGFLLFNCASIWGSKGMLYIEPH